MARNYWDRMSWVAQGTSTINFISTRHHAVIRNTIMIIIIIIMAKQDDDEASSNSYHTRIRLPPACLLGSALTGLSIGQLHLGSNVLAMRFQRSGKFAFGEFICFGSTYLFSCLFCYTNCQAPADFKPVSNFGMKRGRGSCMSSDGWTGQY